MQTAIRQALQAGRETLKGACIESFALDALVLLSHISGLSKETLLSHDEYTLEHNQTANYFNAINKRKAGCPVQYITNKCEFMGIDFYVDENVLIPRADTEIIVELLINSAKAIYNSKDNPTINPKILDLCTGSGCIAISAACYIKGATVIGTDISRACIDIAERNAKAAGVLNSTSFYVSDLFDNISTVGFDAIVSNPPYIPDSDINRLMPQVKEFEPRCALSGGESGLDFYERIASQAKDYVKPGGLLLFEIGYNQGNRVCDILRKNNFFDIKVYKDLAGFDRAVSSIYGGNKC